MTVGYSRHLLRQRHAVASLGGTALRAWLAPLPAGATQQPAPLPGPELIARIPPPAAALVRDYLLHVGGDPGAYRGSVPAHLFLHWSLPLAARTLSGLPYRLLRIVNAGCRIQVGAPLDAGGPFTVRARLEGVADDGRRATLHQRIVTGTDQHPQALIADLYTVVPSSADGAEQARHARAASLRRAEQRVPEDAREIARWTLARGAGLAFAALTGDFNPVHWALPYARALGFSGTILHGFATLARAWEGLHRARFAGAVDRLRVVDARFLRPLVLPADVGLYLSGSQFFVAGAPGARPYLAASFEEAAA